MALAGRGLRPSPHVPGTTASERDPPPSAREAYGPLELIARYVKGDGRALILYTHGGRDRRTGARPRDERGAPQRAARRAGRLRDPPPGPHVPARARALPAVPDPPGRASRPRSRSRRSRSRSSRTASPPSRRRAGRPRWSSTPTATTTRFGTLAPARAEALMWVWRQRYEELGARADVEYVMIFENRGVEVGVTLHHPHGQIYGYPFLPPVPRLELAADARLRRLRAVRAARAASSRTGGASSTRTRRSSPTSRTRRAGPTKRTWCCASTGRACSTASAAELRLLADGAADARARVRRAVRPAVPLRDGRPPGADRRRGGGAAGTCTSSSTRRCAPPRSSSTSPAPSRARARSSPTCSPRSPPPALREAIAACATERVARVRARAREPDRRAHRLQPAASRCRSRSPRASSCARRRPTPDSPGAPADLRPRARPRRARTSSRSPRSPPRRAGARSCAASSPSCSEPAFRCVGARLEIGGDLPRGRRPVLLGRARGRAVPGADRPRRARHGRRRHARADRELARLCARVENDWVGAQTGLLDQLASLYGAPETALRIDFRTLAGRARAAAARGLAARRRSTPASGTRTRARATTSAARECARACELLGVELAARRERRRPSRGCREPLRARAEHVLGENARVERGRRGAARGGPARASARCSTPRTRACATSTRSPRRRSSAPSRGCARPAPRARG